jgi:2,3-bisphosphoglycerate-dependent phosphoglycerate mutase
MIQNSKQDYHLVIVRHGESSWNAKNWFCGWRDPGLTEAGCKEAAIAANVLQQDGFHFDVAFTSLLSRAIKTLDIILEGMDLMWIPVHKSWRLNERHYGRLQGSDKLQAVAKFGKKKVQEWRRSFTIRPPEVDKSSPEYPGFDPRYAALETIELPVGESLKDVYDRIIPYWKSDIIPELKRKKKVLIVAHGNSLRALVKHLETLSDEEIVGVELPTGVPKVYKLDSNFKSVSHAFYGDPDNVTDRINRVAAQTGA